MAFTDKEKMNWIELQMRKAQALADYDAISYTEPEAAKPDQDILGQLGIAEFAYSRLKKDHTGMTREEYIIEIGKLKQEIDTLKKTLKGPEKSVKVKLDKAKSEFELAKDQAKRVYQDILDEEKAAFGFVAKELPLNANSQR